MSGKDVEKWADEYMFEAEAISVSDGPKVYLLSANHDPLGSVAAAAKAYKGEFVQSLAEVTDEERRYYLAEIQKTALAMPLESVNFQFRITGVTRGFTHQLVRQRTAAYSQESTRFAVKSGVPVGLPPSLQGTQSLNERAVQLSIKYPMWSIDECMELAKDAENERDRWRMKWDEAVEKVAEAYNYLVNDGMPAEDARGLLPTNLLTQVNYHTSLRGLQDHSGLRLCTQAQFEWRQVWLQIVEAIQQYGRYVSYDVSVDGVDTGAPYERVGDIARRGSAWQFEALASIFKPICYQRGSCQFGAEFDRKCSIRERVQRFAEHGVPSTEWGQEHQVMDHDGLPSRLLPIYPAEFMYDDGAAR